ncbi:MAG: AAA family ATPase [Phycisphaerae bacterium]|jgi:cytidylate kinase
MRSDLIGYIHDKDQGREYPSEGPFLTISREFGCGGYELAESISKLITERSGENWKIFKKELLEQLARESGIDLETIEKQRFEKPCFVKDMLNAMRQNSTPDSVEVRSRIAFMVRKAAFDGRAIIVGQGGAAATSGMQGGLNVRVEAPRSWRLLRISKREGLSKKEALEKLTEIEKRREYLRKFYTSMGGEAPFFDLVFDNSKFTTAQIAELIFQAMIQLKLVEIGF